MIPYADRWYLFIWGDGYVRPTKRATIKVYQEDFFTDDNGFTEEIIRDIRMLHNGECLNSNGICDVLSIVRVL